MNTALCFSLLADSVWADPMHYWSIARMVIGLGLVIFVHELGHFLVAKACGVKCEKFYIGFDFFDLKLFGVTILPRALFKKQWGETEYGIGIIPLGGYVKMLGQDDNPANYEEEMERSKLRPNKENEEGEKANSSEQGHVSVTDADMEPTPLSDEDDYELDPRSYQAKNVPQRMAIISAGVVMNLIFAVIFAACAYGVGVEYTPCMLGGFAPGSSAWEAGIPPGSQIVQLGKNGKRNEHLRFSHDLRNAVMMADNGSLDVLILEPSGEEVWHTLTPQKTYFRNGRSLPTIGVLAMHTLTVDGLTGKLEGWPAAAADPPFVGGDEIVAVTAGDKRQEIGSYLELESYLAQHAAEELTFHVNRKENEDSDSTVEKDIKVGTTPLVEFGLTMEAGPIASIRSGSPAENAGLKVGDQIVSIAGEPLGHLYSLSRRLNSSYGKLATVEILRDGENKTIDITIETPQAIHRQVGLRGLFAIEEIGVALPILRKVVEVTPDSPADKAGLKAGDLIEKAKFLYEGDDPKVQVPDEEIKLTDEIHNWHFVASQAPEMRNGIQVEITYKRGSETDTIKLAPAEIEGEFNPRRGLMLRSVSEVHTAESFGESVALGFRETKEDLGKVAGFLKKLVTGGISPFNLGGPATIAMVATSEASVSTPRLLLFLTLLSANLAIVNFLPIPVLDGGHMMFLLYEAIFRKPVNERVFVALTLAGFVFVLGLMAFVLSLDAFHIFQMFS